ncbi:MAG TPA: hypothetical protein VJ770_05515 [Stellaceae bacterium]|nr:hypothetical protein [Stellaceae bacterium]
MTESHPPHRHGSARAGSNGLFRSDREQISKARQAAEALFRPKRQDTPPSVSDPHRPAEPSQRTPRILRSLPVPARHAKAEPPADPEPPMPRKIPASQFARIRACVKYGMTIPQVAQVYGVAVGEIERILGKA